MKRWMIVLGALALLALAVQVLAIVGDAARPRVSDLARGAPRRTALMRARAAEARKSGRAYRVDQEWVPYERISPLLRHAVLIAEDDAFFSHGGLDWHEIGESARSNLRKGRVLRGGSTISQQLAKNLYLGQERTLNRKLEEVVLALRLERALTKRRIFELYLNLIEWGDGIYGAEAAARRHFGVSTADLDPRQAALLAAVIVNPRRYSAAAPSRRIEARMRMILRRMARRGLVTEEEYRAALAPAPPAGVLDWLFGPPRESRTWPDSAAAPPGATAESTAADSGAPAADSLPP